jgi:hypothetical protein
MDTSLVNYEFELIASLVTAIMDLITSRIFNLPQMKTESAVQWMCLQ